MSKKSSKKKTSDDTFTYILIGLIIVGIGYYYYYYIHNRDYDPAQIGGTKEVAGTIEEEDDDEETENTPKPQVPNKPYEPPKPVEKPKPTWLYKNIARNMIVNGETIIASSTYGAAPIKLNQRAAHKIEHCVNACKAISGSNVAAIAPLRTKTMASCQCYNVKNKLKLSSDVSLTSKISYLSTVEEVPADTCSNTQACASQTSIDQSPGTKTCNDASQPKMYGYHQYHTTDSLINNTYTHIWFDSDTKKLMYKRRNNPADIGKLVYGMPSGVSFGDIYTVFKNNNRLTADFELGLVYLSSAPKPVSHSTNNAEYTRVRVNGRWYDWAIILQCAILRDGKTGKITNKKGVSPHSFTTSRTAKISKGKMTESPDEMVMFEHNNELYVFVNRMAIESSSTALSAIPIYPQITYTQSHGDSSLFHYGTMKFEQVVEWSGAQTDVWLIIHAPTGKMNGHTFVPTSNTMYTYYVKNSATPDNCLSCQEREHTACPPNTVLIGCGFGNKGRCGTCYMSSTEHGMAKREDNIDDSPCGNCQIGRLMVKTPNGKIWTDANRRILENSVSPNTNIDNKFTGPFVNTYTGKSGKFSIEAGMNNTQLYRRLQKAAVDTGRTNPTAAPAYCNLATGSIKYSNTENTKMATGSNTWKQFKNFGYISTLNADSYGPAICQLGTTAPNKFDGGFCTIGYADVHLKNFSVDGASQEWGSNHDGKGCLNAVNTSDAKRQYTKYTQMAAKHMDLEVQWTIVPRLVFPFSSPPVYNPYIGIQFIQGLTLAVTIYNTAYTDGATPVTAADHAKYNEGKISYKFTFNADELSKAENFTKTKLIVLPPYSDIRVGGSNGHRVVHNINVDFLDFIPSLSGFSNGCTVTDVTPANMMEDKEKYTPVDKKSNFVKSKLLKTVPSSQCDKNNCMQFDPVNHHIVPHQKRTIRGQPSFARCYKLESGPCKSNRHYAAWHVPRIVAECRVMGAKPGDAFIEHHKGCHHEGTHAIRTDCGPTNGSTKDYRIWQGISVEKPPPINGNYNGWSGRMDSKAVKGGCHPNDCIVSTEHGEVAVQCLNIGDRIYTPSGYEPIIGFFDNNNTNMAEYYEIALENNETITISRHHAIPINGIMTDPSLIKNGDVINTVSGITTVTSNTNIIKQGAHHFLVPSGLYYIDNVVCSDYTMHVPFELFKIVHMYIRARYTMGVPIIYREQSVFSPYWPYHILGKINAPTIVYNACSVLFVPLVILTEFILAIYVSMSKKM
ncbi:hypothetical protein EXVG_00086 [Emiliania huxleyi virus 202]|nr:hypothetical protein EXVG_00086 [Emiliania huxleyi virus 202]